MSDRARFRYTSDEGGPVDLPAFLLARPGTVEPGDVFEADAEHAETLVERSGGRFVRLSDDEPFGPYASMTLAELRDELDRRGLDASVRTKAAAREALEAHDRAHPLPPSDPDVDVEQGSSDVLPPNETPEA